MVVEVTLVATQQKPTPIFSGDADSLKRVGVPSALAEQLAEHREELAERFHHTRQAIAEGDAGRIDQIVAAGQEAEVEATMAHFPT